MTSRLNPDDQARVDQVINSGVYAPSRKPFRPWLLLIIIQLVLATLGGISYWIASLQGVV